MKVLQRGQIYAYVTIGKADWAGWAGAYGAPFGHSADVGRSIPVDTKAPTWVWMDTYTLNNHTVWQVKLEDLERRMENEFGPVSP